LILRRWRQGPRQKEGSQAESGPTVLKGTADERPQPKGKKEMKAGWKEKKKEVEVNTFPRSQKS
jgi:hypothetical protein